MDIKISLLSKLSRKEWLLKYNNSDFEKILVSILRLVDYDYAQITVWSSQADLFNINDSIIISERKKYSTFKLKKSKCVSFIDEQFLEKIRLFKIVLKDKNNNTFIFDSDNYGEYTSIRVPKSIHEKELKLILSRL